MAQLDRGGNKMKRDRLLLLTPILTLGFATMIYAATSSTTLKVAAIVQSTVDVTTTLMNFGTIDPTINGNAADAFINLTMPAQQPYTIALDRGFNFFSNTRHMNASFPGFGAIPYKLLQPDLTTEWGDNGFGNTYPAGSPLQVIGTGSFQSHRVHGVTQPPTSAVSSGGFNDSVLVTIHF
jgi:spore coat protein U-like protein